MGGAGRQTRLEAKETVSLEERRDQTVGNGLGVWIKSQEIPRFLFVPR